MNPILFGKPSAMMKRKRSIHQGEFSSKQNISENDREEDDDDDLLANEYNDDSNSSLASSNSKSSTASSSTTGSLLKAQRIKHGHKIIITEERMNEAMHDLKLEIDSLQESKPVNTNDVEFQMSNDDTIIDDDDVISNETEGAILVSEELKAKLRQYKMKDLLLNSHFKHPMSEQQHQDVNTMQLVLWTPSLHHFAHSISYDSSASIDSDGDQDSDTSFSSSSSSGGHNTSTSGYKVEEPFDIYKKNRLKRKFSQMNKILIEEVNNKLNEQQNDQVKRPDQACNFYLVDECETTTSSTKNTTSGFKQDQTTSKSVFSIVELPIEDEEKMEM